MPVKGLPPSGANDIINLSFSAGFGGGGSMEKCKNLFRLFTSSIYRAFTNITAKFRNIFTFENLFWPMIIFLVVYLAFGCICHYLGKCAGGLLDYLFPPIDITNIIVGIILFMLGIEIQKYESRRRSQEELEKELAELKLLPPKEALLKSAKVFSRAKNEGWFDKLIEIVQKRKDEFFEEPIEFDDLKQVIKFLEAVPRVNEDHRFVFLRSYLEEDWGTLRANLPNWLEEFWEKEQWRKGYLRSCSKML
jgi:hypothetical protein